MPYKFYLNLLILLHQTLMQSEHNFTVPITLANKNHELMKVSICSCLISNGSYQPITKRAKWVKRVNRVIVYLFMHKHLVSKDMTYYKT